MSSMSSESGLLGGQDPSISPGGTATRAFARRLQKNLPAAEARRIASSVFSERNEVDQSAAATKLPAAAQALASLEVPKPVDYEAFLKEHRKLVEADNRKDLLLFPSDDIEVCTEPRYVRTIDSAIPAATRDVNTPHLRDCVHMYTTDWHVMRFKHAFKGRDRLAVLHKLQGDKQKLWRQDDLKEEYEIDLPSDETRSLQSFQSMNSSMSSTSSRTSTLDRKRPVSPLSISSAVSSTDVSSVCDLEMTEEDELYIDLLEEEDEDRVDEENRQRRQQNREDMLFSLYPFTDAETHIENRPEPLPPAEQIGYRLSVKCLDLQLELEVEPFFAVMALYDVKEKRKISENFHFDLNSSVISKMLDMHGKEQSMPSLSRTAVFSITFPHPDIFLVVKLEKVLQKDINECAEPYIKENDSAKNRERVKMAAQQACERLGKYRMPFAWTAIHIQDIVTNSQQSTYEHRRETAARAEEARAAAKAAVDRRAEDSRSTGLLFAPGQTGCVTSDTLDPLCTSLVCFKPVTLTVNSFFKQEGDKLENEDLYRFLAELKKPASIVRRLKCIPGTLKLDISFPSDRLVNCMTPNLLQIKPYPEAHVRPIREVLEFPSREVYIPFASYKNFLHVYPQHLNFANRAGSARNIAIKVQLMEGEDEGAALKCLYGKSSSAKFLKEAWTAVTYHNKTPDFYEEVKMDLPVEVKDSHHILFSFYHISCSKPKANETGPVEPVLLGYTWLPLLKDGLIQEGEFFYPVTAEKPPQAFSLLSPEVFLPNLKWVDNHKPVFRFAVQVTSSIHVQDKHIYSFLSAVNQGSSPISRRDPRRHTTTSSGSDFEMISGISNSPDAVLSRRVDNLARLVSPEPLMRFLPLILNKLFYLLVRTTKGSVTGQVSEKAFESLAVIVKQVHNNLDESCDMHGRCDQLRTYVTYIFDSNSLGDSPPAFSAPDGPSSSSQTSNSLKHRPRSVMLGSTSSGDSAELADGDSKRKTIHNELVSQWILAAQPVKDMAFLHGWFFFEIMIKSMAQQLSRSNRLGLPPEQRFSTRFVDDLGKLVSHISEEIVKRHIKDSRFSRSLNTSLAFLIRDSFSFIDRGAVFGIIRTYLRQVSMAAAADFSLAEMKFDLLRVVCSHEHYVQLNLPLTPQAMMEVVGENCIAYSHSPFEMPQTPSRQEPTSNGHSSDDNTAMNSATDDPTDAEASMVSLMRTPSLASISSTSTEVSVRLTEENVYSELSNEFRRVHFLTGLLLTELAVILETQSAKLHRQAINTLRDLMMSHDMDSDSDQRARIALLYMPVLGIITDHYTRLCRDFATPASASTQGADSVGGEGDTDSLFSDDGTGSLKRASLFNELMPSLTKRASNILTQENTRSLLLCFLWILKSVSERQLRRWWLQLEFARKTMVLDVLDLCVHAFEYKGRQASISATGAPATSTDVKARLANAILSGTGTAREKMMERRKQQQGGNVASDGGRRWGTTTYQQSVDSTLRSTQDTNVIVDLEAHLGTESSLVILDTLELVVDASQQLDCIGTILSYVLTVLLHLLSVNQSTSALTHIFASQRSFVSKYPDYLFEQETEQSSELCAILLRLCGSALATTRSQASASLYMLMRHNFDLGQSFARVKVQSTVALSTLVAGSQDFCNADCLRKSLKTIMMYAEQDDAMCNSPFPDQVKELVFNLHMILRDTVNLNQYKEDPDMLLDLMVRIAKGYQNSPDLRLTWLQNMAQKHTECSNLVEAGMCMVHASSLVAEYLSMLEDDTFFPAGCASFEKITPNVLEESAISDDVLAPDDEGICTGKLFAVKGLVGLIENAGMLFEQGGLWEVACMLHQLLVPIHEMNRDHKKLAKIYSKMAKLQNRIVEETSRRNMGSYFRVTFYGSRFEDLDGADFIYKERSHMRLAEISLRFEHFYQAQFGAENLEIIKDSKEPNRSRLDPDKAYIQITFVEPYFDNYELKGRRTYFERNYNICRFYFDIPFTEGGKAHGDLANQCKRRTILKTANVFPYVKTRIVVIHKESYVLSPAEVALEDMQKKYDRLIEVVRQQPSDVKGLQLQLQGSIGTTVNQGPAEMALVFLGDAERVSQDRTLRKLKHCFRDFMRGCAEGLERNKELISDNQREYQRELERNFVDFRRKLEPIFGKKTSQRWIKKNREKTVLQNISRPSSTQLLVHRP